MTRSTQDRGTRDRIIWKYLEKRGSSKVIERNNVEGKPGKMREQIERGREIDVGKITDLSGGGPHNFASY